MKKVLGILTVLCIGVFALSACDSGSDTRGKIKGEKSVVVASEISDGAAKYNPNQRMCPVCGKSIKPEYYIDLDKGRLYFNSEECLKKFKKNKSQYM